MIYLHLSVVPVCRVVSTFKVRLLVQVELLRELDPVARVAALAGLQLGPDHGELRPVQRAVLYCTVLYCTVLYLWSGLAASWLERKSLYPDTRLRFLLAANTRNSVTTSDAASAGGIPLQH